MTLIDTHAHLDDRAFAADVAEVLDRARRNEIAAIVTVGTDAESSRRARALAEREPDIWAAIGIHPHEADRAPSAEPLREIAGHPRVVAIGETGLDYAKRYAAPENQKRLFLSHLSLARDLRKPVVIHCREAHADAIAILRADGTKGVIHCFSGTARDAAAYVEMGFFLSIAGPVTYPNAHGLREAVREIPLERLLVETDCPLLAPQAHRGKRNEPAYVRHTAAEVARIHGVALEELAARTTGNARRIFGLA